MHTVEIIWLVGFYIIISFTYGEEAAEEIGRILARPFKYFFAGVFLLFIPILGWLMLIFYAVFILCSPIAILFFFKDLKYGYRDERNNDWSW